MTHHFLKLCGACGAMGFAFVLPLLSSKSLGADAGVIDKPAAASDVDQPTLAHEPNYKSTPRYALLAFGAKGESKLWLVEDGESLYLDRNQNGDLTDDGPPVIGKVQGTAVSYDLDVIALADGSRHSKFDLSRWKSGDKDDTYALSVMVNERVPMYAGWFGTFVSSSPKTAPVVRMGAPLRPRLMTYNEFTAPASSKNPDARWFRGFPLEPFKPNRDSRRLAVAFVEPGGGEGAESRLSIDAIRSDVIPVVEINWPVAQGAAPLRTSHRLTDRCCYWVYYDTTFTVPQGVVPGTATVTVSVPAEAMPLPLATETIKVPVVDKEEIADPKK
jgi:hypothetical protein